MYKKVYLYNLYLTVQYTYISIIYHNIRLESYYIDDILIHIITQLYISYVNLTNYNATHIYTCTSTVEYDWEQSLSLFSLVELNRSHFLHLTIWFRSTSGAQSRVHIRRILVLRSTFVEKWRARPEWSLLSRPSTSSRGVQWFWFSWNGVRVSRFPFASDPRSQGTWWIRRIVRCSCTDHSGCRHHISWYCCKLSRARHKLPSLCEKNRKMRYIIYCIRQ